jgi:hypothetical protein
MTASYPIADSASLSGIRETTLIDEHADRLFALGTLAGPGVELPDAVADGSGRYDLVLAGELELDDEILPTHSLLYSLAGERLPGRKAGSTGVQLLTIQMPARDRILPPTPSKGV